MFEIKVTVDLPGIPEAINNLAAVFAGKCAGMENKATQEAVASAVVAAPAIVSDPTPVAPAPLSVQQTAPAPALVPQTVTAPAPQEAPVAAPVPAPAPVKVYTFDEISVAGAALCNQGTEMTDRLVALLQTKYGVDSIVDLPESKYGDIAVDLQSLGAKMG